VAVIEQLIGAYVALGSLKEESRMRIILPISCVAPVVGLLSFTGAAWAQDSQGTPVPSQPTTVGEGQPPQNLPPPTSYNEPAPPPPAPTVAMGGVTEQAGIGGTQAYARAGVLELGGFANFTFADSFTQIGFAPTVGWFFVDNLEISAIININYVNQDVTIETPSGTESENVDSTVMLLLAEPSIHIPFQESLYGFLGVGFGLAHQGGDDGAGTGFAIAPRLGVNVLVGRSGIFTPALTGVYQTTEAVQTPSGTVVGVSSSFGIQAGYTVMW
jgi:hypothetical protein